MMTPEYLLELRDFRLVARYTTATGGRGKKLFLANMPEQAVSHVEHIQSECALTNACALTVDVQAVHPSARYRFLDIDTAALLDAVQPEYAAMRAAHRRMRADAEAQEKKNQITARASRRLVAENIDTTGDFLDPRCGDVPLLAFSF